MIFATGGLALGETRTKSWFAWSAKRNASALSLTPSWAPSAPISRTSRARIFSLTIKSLAMGSHLQNVIDDIIINPMQKLRAQKHPQYQFISKLTNVLT
ncbi:hypothetical protein FC84_GL001224 [Lapidilactobacillus dextrinicus DSM 20335]|jgi:hypothetical protein|uniref:Uncharacterized protein n=1 Tax=Lapidilactobacillus dextrinicus DSM 20335 TaxID=1423738 RepID=A0A0R2BGD7_9LACO|nr:hypothetical protein FC84_GL001224 [Lapidilactobacillus dextrinicus DSM 20335]